MKQVTNIQVGQVINMCGRNADFKTYFGEDFEVLKVFEADKEMKAAGILKVFWAKHLASGSVELCMLFDENEGEPVVVEIEDNDEEVFPL